MGTTSAQLRKLRRNGKFKPVWKLDATILDLMIVASATSFLIEEPGEPIAATHLPEHDPLARWHFWLIKLMILPPAGLRRPLFVTCWLANRVNIAKSWHGWMGWLQRMCLVSGGRRGHCVESFEQDQRHSKNSGIELLGQLLARTPRILQCETR